MAVVQSQPITDRIVTVVDAADPTDNLQAGVVDASGWERVEWQLDYTTAGGVPGLNVVPIWWDTNAAAWFQDLEQGRNYVSPQVPAKVMFPVDIRSRYAFLKVTTLNGTTPQVKISHRLQKTRVI